MDQTAFEQLVRYILMAIIVTGSFGLASGIVIWSVKSYINLRTKIPRASCSYITMKDLTEHCTRQSGGLREIMETKLDAAIGALNERLKAGDKIFSDHRDRLREVEKQLGDKVQTLGSLQKDLMDMLNGERKTGSP